MSKKGSVINEESSLLGYLDIFAIIIFYLFIVTQGQPYKEIQEIIGPRIKVLQSDQKVAQSPGGGRLKPTFLSITNEDKRRVYYLNERRLPFKKVIEHVGKTRTRSIVVRIDRQKEKELAEFVNHISQLQKAGIRAMSYSFEEDMP